MVYVYISLFFSVGDSDLINVDEPLPSVQNATNAMYSSCLYICPFNENENELDLWPCRYTVMVEDVFKGELTVSKILSMPCFSCMY